MNIVDGIPTYSENDLTNFYLKKRALEEIVISESTPNLKINGVSRLTINSNYYNWEMTMHMYDFMCLVNYGSFHSAAKNLNRSIQSNIAYLYIKHCNIKLGTLL